ncbi:MAG: dihydropteroate synthase [Vicinamibacterales bacterium]|nr:dihydropteroate synthase [Vicinamibacterales bacterium]
MSFRKNFDIPLADGRVLALGPRPLVMGILNVTPDSFADASPSLDAAIAIDRALQMQEEGANILDVGGESTRPGTEPVTASEELSRVLPVVKALARRVRVPISVDTYRARVARAVIAEGASIINDISGLRYEPELADVVAGSLVALVLMHMRGRPKGMYAEAVYHELMGEVTAELKTSMTVAAAAGVEPGRVIVDPGIGFAKQPNDSYGVLARLSELASALDRPVLVGPSRKSFMREALAGRPAPERDWGTAAAVTAAVLAGVHIVRVHAVGEMVQVVRVAEEIRRHAP